MADFTANLPARVITIAAIVVAYDGAAAFAFLAGMRRQRLPSYAAAIGVLLAHAAVFALRGVVAAALPMDATGPLLPAATWTSALTILSFALTAGLTVLLVALAREQGAFASNAVLAAARDLAAAANAEKSRFLARMSHELRNPLNGVLGLAEALARDPALPPRQRDQVETLERAGRHVLAIVNDVLDLAKVEAGRLELAPVPVRLRTQLEEALELIEPAATTRRIELRLDLARDLPDGVLADPVRLRQVLLNLLGNAVKFTPEGGDVVLRAEPAGAKQAGAKQAGAAELRLIVINSGPGIPAALRPRLFEEFAKASRPGRGPGWAWPSPPGWCAPWAASWTLPRGPRGVAAPSPQPCPWWRLLRRHRRSSRRWRSRGRPRPARCGCWWWMTRRSTGRWSAPCCAQKAMSSTRRRTASPPSPRCSGPAAGSGADGCQHAGHGRLPGDGGDPRAGRAGGPGAGDRADRRRHAGSRGGRASPGSDGHLTKPLRRAVLRGNRAAGPRHCGQGALKARRAGSMAGDPVTPLRRAGVLVPGGRGALGSFGSRMPLACGMLAWPGIRSTERGHARPLPSRLVPPGAPRVQAWGEPWTGAIGRDWMVPDLFCDMAPRLERACFDYILIEDSSYVGESYGSSREVYLKHGLAVPRQDPGDHRDADGGGDQRIGIVPTFATFTHPPYLLARMIASLDQVIRGRIGWNMVTGSSDVAARNYGLPRLPEHDLRYDMADEYMQVVNGLWDSWEPGRHRRRPRDSGMLVDHTKVHEVDFEGR